MGLALDLTNKEQLCVITGEELQPPSPVVWALTSHGGLIAWTLVHKKARGTSSKSRGWHLAIVQHATPTVINRK